jgi:predicted short-subunit dehydrogenase-like oxidoreductase (DUF2520 family)
MMRFCYASAMLRRPRIAIVGAGNLGSALAHALRRAGYTIDSVVAHSRGASLKNAQKLAREIGAEALVDPRELRADVIWFAVPDGAIARVARDFAGLPKRASSKQAASNQKPWKGKIALHSSGALTSDELADLRRHGAAVGSAHPLMTFVARSQPPLAGVPFAIEGDAAAMRAARRIVRDLGGQAYAIRKQEKTAYHAWGAFASPLFTALLATSEEVAALGGVRKDEARRRMLPILLQTLANYATLGAPNGFSGPIVRGDVETVKRHLRVLRRLPAARKVYTALAEAAMLYLPSKNRKDLARALRG